MTTIRNIAVAAFALSAVAGIGAASARDVHHIGVRTGDLNLATTQGQATLDARLRAAVRDVCADQREGAAGFDYGRCIAAARKSANAGRSMAMAEAQRGTQLASR